mmetsp:Transcript_28461/g.89950  ORF Transcript_28461/g.89950 Transcript_28461/m.89950 type:complete len:219 (+) Transcript_28461:563-1219(+)
MPSSPSVLLSLPLQTSTASVEHHCRTTGGMLPPPPAAYPCQHAAGHRPCCAGAPTALLRERPLWPGLASEMPLSPWGSSAVGLAACPNVVAAAAAWASLARARRPRARPLGAMWAAASGPPHCSAMLRAAPVAPAAAARRSAGKGEPATSAGRAGAATGALAAGSRTSCSGCMLPSSVRRNSRKSASRRCLPSHGDSGISSVSCIVAEGAWVGEGQEA